MAKGLYCSKYEVTNKEYRAFLNYMKKEDLNSYERFKIDSLQWVKMDESLDKKARLYGWHPAFDDYPVVNISHQAAIKYCAWLNSKNGDNRIVFRLPSAAEFAQVLDIINVKLSSDNATDYTCPNFNLNFIGDPSIDGGQFTVPVKINDKKAPVTFQQNDNGITHIIGNVAEYLQDGKTMGGSWSSYPSEVLVIQEPTDINPKTGFRIWMQKIESN